MKPHKTTPEEFKLFKDTIRALLGKFGMNEWKVYYELKRMPDCSAQCSTDSVGMIVTFCLNTVIFCETQEDMKEICLHEVCHLLLAEIVDLVYKRFVTKDILVNADERITRRITNLFRGLGVWGIERRE